MERLGQPLTRRVFLAASVVGLAAACGGAGLVYRESQFGDEHAPTYGDQQHITSETDLIEGRHWQMSGVRHDTAKNVLYVSNHGNAIVNQDGSYGQPNNPINLYGVRASVTGDFALDVSLRNISGVAEVDLYGEPPLIEDEFRIEKSTARLTFNGDSMIVALYNTMGTKPDATKRFNLSHGNARDLRVVRDGDELQFSVGDKYLGSMQHANSLFSSGSVWFGFAADGQGASFAVDRMDLIGVNKHTASIVDGRNLDVPQKPEGLASLLRERRSDFTLGTAIALGPLAADASYRSVLGNFSGITTENAFKWQFVHPMPGNSVSSYNFAETDAMVDIAEKSGMRVHGHTLVFGEANPQWLQDLAASKPGDVESIMTNHISTVVGRYKGRVASWDVINEPLADYDTQPGEYGLRKHLWYRALGAGYIATALRAAHQADPSAELWINDFGLETDDERFADMMKLLSMLKKQQVPLTGLGFQAHIDEGDTIQGDTHIDAELLRKRMRAVAALGYKVRISELDVTNEQEYPVYKDVLSVALGEPNCVGLTTWGVSDRYSSSSYIEDGRLKTGIGLLWDAQMRPRSAVDDLTKFLKK